MLRFVYLALFCTIILTQRAQSLDYFWVGGSGNWSDIRHWATTSGGKVQHNQVPTAFDNVIFDQNSFTGPNQSVTINLDVIFCKNLDFRNLDQVVNFNGPKNSSIRLYGSVYLTSNVRMNFGGRFEMKSDSPGNELDFNGYQIHRLDFLGRGSWTFTADVDVDSLIRIEFGKINLGNVSLKCERFEVFAGSSVEINFANSVLEITGDRVRDMTYYQWHESLEIRGSDINTIAGNSTIIFTGFKASIGIFDHVSRMDLGRVTLGRANGEHMLAIWGGGDFRFAKLHLRGNTEVYGNFWMDNLELDGGQIFSFQSGTVQTVRQFFTNSDCSKYVLLRSMEGGNAFSMMGIGGIQTISYAVIKDVNVTGAATFTANNSIDLGGNSGWNIQNKTSETFFWVGGSGLWSDPQHWSLSSGGTSAGCLPSPADDVIFDEKSFTQADQSVFIDLQSAFCRSMDWRSIDESTFIDYIPLESINTLHVFGSLWFSPMLTNMFQGDVYFEASTRGHVIQSAGIEFLSNVVFDGAGGEWILLDKLDIRDSLLFNGGTLRMNNQEIETWNLYSETSSRRTFDMSPSSVLHFVHLDERPWEASSIHFNTNNLTMIPGKSTVIGDDWFGMWAYGNGEVHFHNMYLSGNSFNINSRWENTKFYANRVECYWNGSFEGEMTIDTLVFSPGLEYSFEMNANVIVEDLIANGTCQGNPYIHSGQKNVQAKITSNSALIDLVNVTLEDIVAEGSATFNASNSVDMGGNVNWNFTDASPRTLYWVNGDGDWLDTAHWSLSSGGPGGACLPTNIDDVIFDENSFTGDYQGVILSGGSAPVCHNMTWRNTRMGSNAYHGDLTISGSLFLDDGQNFDPWGIRFRTNDTVTVDTRGEGISWVQFMGRGTWNLLSEFHIENFMELSEGTLITNDHRVRIHELSAHNYPVDKKRALVLGNSHVIMGGGYDSRGEMYFRTDSLMIDPGSSLVEFIYPTSEIRNFHRLTLNFHNVLFSSNQGLSYIEQSEEDSRFTANKVQFNNNAILTGSNEMDSLILAPGKVYQFQDGKNQRIDKHLFARGTNCTPISMISTNPGNRTTITSSSAEIVADFVQMQDHHATGGANFFAGNNSTDISNNTGWIFGNPPDHIETGFLGEDRVLCRGQSETLDAYNFNPDETYLWSNGSIDSAITIDNPGRYWVEVNFASGCVLLDTVNIIAPVDFQPDLGPDTILCEGEVLILNADVMAQGARYTWQDSTTAQIFNVSSPGSYSVEVVLGECSSYDSVRIDYIALPDFELTNSLDLCDGDTLVLDVTLPNATYLWQDGSSDPLHLITADGIYWVEVSANSCSARDTLDITFAPLPQFNLGPDTTLCDGQTILLDATVAGGTYDWSDNSQNAILTIATQGLFWVEVTADNCRSRDSIVINYNPLPIVSLGSDTSLCEGTSMTLSYSEPGTSYQWNTGSTSGMLDISRSGTYWLEGQLNGCLKRDTIEIAFESPPSIDLGLDTSLCDGEVLSYNFQEPNVNYLWNDFSALGSHTINSDGRYWLTASKLNCTVSDSILVQYNPIPVFSLGIDLHKCPGELFTLSPDRMAQGYQWVDGSTGQSFRGSTPGQYWVKLTDLGCSFTDTINVSYSDPIIIDLGNDTTICENTVFQLDATHPAAVSYQWSNGETEPIITTSAPGLYQVQASDGFCSFDADLFVNLRECHYFSRFAPNIFSPNGDGVNDDFIIHLEPGIEIQRFVLRIFNRWGNLVYETTNHLQGWDGTWNGEKMPRDVYVYSLEVDYVDDSGPGNFTEGGDVLLIDH